MGLFTNLKRFVPYEARIKRLETLMSDMQAKIDAETAQVTAINTTLTTYVPLVKAGFANLETEIADLKAANATIPVPLDFSKLDAALAATQANAAPLETLVPADALPVTSTTVTPTAPTA